MTRPQAAWAYLRHRRAHWTRANRRRRPSSARDMLALIPSLPRSVLSRLTEAMINRMDDIDGDPDLEDGHDAEQVDDV